MKPFLRWILGLMTMAAGCAPSSTGTRPEKPSASPFKEESVALLKRWMDREQDLVREASLIRPEEVRALAARHREVPVELGDAALRGFKTLFYFGVLKTGELSEDTVDVPLMSAFEVCTRYGLVDAKQEALDWFQLSALAGLFVLPRLDQVIANPIFDPIRNEPRFARIVAGQATLRPAAGKGYLGLSILDLSPDECNRLLVPVGEAVVITEIIGGSPAASCGLNVGDVIVRIEDDAGDRWNGICADYLAWVQSKRGGTRIAVTVLREEKTVRIPVVLGTQ